MNKRKILYIIIVLLVLLLAKLLWVGLSCRNIGTWEDEKADILGRSDYLAEKVIVDPSVLISEMPRAIGAQFKGEWALYSCSMNAKALANISSLYPETREENIARIDSLIEIVLSPQIRGYDAVRWGEDPLKSLQGSNSHISYLSHLAWMIGNYKSIGGCNKHDEIYGQACAAMDRRIRVSKSLNLPTYPDEPIYVPDMLVAIVALNDYANAYCGKYANTVNLWLQRAKSEWLDEKTGLLVSFLDEDGHQLVDAPVKGSYSALNSYYLALIDYDFGKQQYQLLKSTFLRDGFMAGIKEYADRSPLIEEDVDAGIILFGLTPSGTAFSIGPATVYDDADVRKNLLRTAEIAGHSVGNTHRHYLLAKIALVGEAITLSMRTTHTSSPRSND